MDGWMDGWMGFGYQAWARGGGVCVSDFETYSCRHALVTDAKEVVLGCKAPCCRLARGKRDAVVGCKLIKLCVVQSKRL